MSNKENSSSSNSSTLSVFSQVYRNLVVDYQKNQNKKLLMVDAFILYSISTAIIQAIYMVLVGTFPFNSFLSGFFCHIGLFALGVSLRLQLSSTDEFSNVEPEKAFGDFAFAAVVLLFVVFSFLG
mmetsp:Transcript_29159/g.31790  ORF Transcript_29159/g.31790 Transcript_29159/m.31790 type:complete len:125 (-) Transcript_29159:158-532(-)